MMEKFTFVLAKLGFIVYTIVITLRLNMGNLVYKNIS